MIKIINNDGKKQSMILQYIQYHISPKKLHLKSTHITLSILLHHVFFSLKFISWSPKSIIMLWRKKCSLVRTFKSKHTYEINFIINYVINVIKPVLIRRNFKQIAPYHHTSLSF